MKYDTWEDFRFFILGASIAAGRTFWTNTGESNKSTKVKSATVSKIKGGQIARLKIERNQHPQN